MGGDVRTAEKGPKTSDCADNSLPGRLVGDPLVLPSITDKIVAVVAVVQASLEAFLPQHGFRDHLKRNTHMNGCPGVLLLFSV